MSSIFDYLDWRGDIPLYFAGFNELDSLILARLSYIPFDGIVSEDFLSKITVAEAAARFLTPMSHKKSRQERGSHTAQKNC